MKAGERGRGGRERGRERGVRREGGGIGGRRWKVKAGDRDHGRPQMQVVGVEQG